jgi:hypothetical protein
MPDPPFERQADEDIFPGIHWFFYEIDCRGGEFLDQLL